MSLYTKEQRVWVKSQQSLGFVTEARYVGKPRRAEYVIELVESVKRLIDGEMRYVPRNRDWMCGSSDLRAADYCCDGCSRWLRGTPHQYAPDGEYPNGLAFCFLCTSPVVLSRKSRELADAYGWTYHP